MTKTLSVAILILGAAAKLPAASTWTQLFSTSGGWDGVIDTGLSGHSAVYDPATNTMIVFGGNASTLSFATTNQVVILSNANGLGGASAFSILIPNGTSGAPPSRTDHTAAYDPASNRMIVFGGATYLDGQSDPSAYLNDVWVLSNANGQGGAPVWTQLNPAGTLPQPRYGQSAAYDAANNILIVFGGGYQHVLFRDVWVLSHANGLGGTPTWTELSPAGAPPVCCGSATYDAANNIMTVFGGYSYASNSLGFALYNAVWTLSHANGLGGKSRWTNIVANGAPGSPAKRAGMSAVYDGANNRMTIFGGGSYGADGYPGYDDVWFLANANGLGGAPAWKEMRTASVAPARRNAHTGVYDAASNRMIVFAGYGTDAQFYSAWVLTGANGL